MWIVDVSGGALFPRRYLDEYEKRVFQLHRCVERAREHNADAIRQAAGFLLDAAAAHEQAAIAYELAGGNGHARAFQARAMRHRQAAAARRAAAAALASGVLKGRVSDDSRPQAAIPDGDPPGLPGEPDAGTDHLGVSCGNGHEQQRDTRFCELPRDVTYRAAGPAQAVLPLAVLLLAAVCAGNLVRPGERCRWQGRSCSGFRRGCGWFSPRGPACCAIMIGCASATGLPQRDERVRLAAAAAGERPGQGRGDPGAAAPDHGPGAAAWHDPAMVLP